LINNKPVEIDSAAYHGYVKSLMFNKKWKPHMNETVARFIKRHHRPFIVKVSVYEGVWTAVCDILGLVTEADSYEQLTERAWTIAPELIELNAIHVAGDIRLQFTHTKTINKVAL
jgi:hypothetical protein